MTDNNKCGRKSQITGIDNTCKSLTDSMMQTSVVVWATARLVNKKTGKSNYPPSAQHIAAVEELVKNGSTLPIYIMYFRARHFHTWTEPYRRIDSTYFSYSKKYM